MRGCPHLHCAEDWSNIYEGDGCFILNFKLNQKLGEAVNEFFAKSACTLQCNS
jgi:hypothetical protein